MTQMGRWLQKPWEGTEVTLMVEPLLGPGRRAQAQSPASLGKAATPWKEWTVLLLMGMEGWHDSREDGSFLAL